MKFVIPGLVSALLALAGYMSYQISEIRGELHDGYVPRTEVVFRFNTLNAKIDDFRIEQREVNSKVLDDLDQLKRGQSP